MSIQAKHDMRKVFDWIVEYKRAHDGNSPSLREIMTGCGIASLSTITYKIRQMESQGWITLAGRGKSRYIVVIGGEWRMNGVVK